MNKLSIFLTLFAILFTLVSSYPMAIYEPETSNQLEKRQSKGKIISKSSAFTYYWIAYESDFKSSKKVDIKTCEDKTIENVNYDFAKSLRLEGTGVTKSGRVVNLGDCECNDGFSCFEEINRNKFPFGQGSNGNPLVPFVSVACNDIKYGTLLYIPQLDNIVLPNNKVHNGCVRVDDEGWSFGKKHVDWFVVRESNYKILNAKYPFDKVSVYEGVAQKCPLLNYI